MWDLKQKVCERESECCCTWGVVGCKRCDTKECFVDGPQPVDFHVWFRGKVALQSAAMCPVRNIGGKTDGRRINVTYFESYSFAPTACMEPRLHPRQIAKIHSKKEVAAWPTKYVAKDGPCILDIS